MTEEEDKPFAGAGSGPAVHATAGAGPVDVRDDEETEHTDPGIRTTDAGYATLIEAAKAVRDNAHAPYSKYRVGAALLTRSGHIYIGCNVENATYGATICAERSAVTAMVAAGDSDPVAVAIVTGPGAVDSSSANSEDRAASPCGICRQVLYEFADDLDVVLILTTPSGDVRRDTTLSVLLPDGFRLIRGSHPE